MRTTMMPSPTAPEIRTAPSALFEIAPAALEVLGITDTGDLFAVALADETEEERAAREAAAADILDDRLTEIAHNALSTESIGGWVA
jgi:arylsulfatase A-like enzyme